MKKPRIKFVFRLSCKSHRRRLDLMWNDRFYKVWMAHCGICGEFGEIRKTRNGAIKAWNRKQRVTTSAKLQGTRDGG